MEAQKVAIPVGGDVTQCEGTSVQALIEPAEEYGEGRPSEQGGPGAAQKTMPGLVDCLRTRPRPTDPG